MSITFESTGSFQNTERFLKRVSSGQIFKALDKYGQEGTSALASVTPVDTGGTAAAWFHRVEKTGGGWTISWMNGKNVAGKPLVIMLQYGHGTGTGGYVQGRDFINPAIRPVFDRIAEAVWREVTRA